MSAPVAPIPGFAGKTYRNTSIILGSTQVWDLMPSIREVDFPLSFGKYDATARVSAGFKMEEPTLAELSGSLTMLYDPADEDMVAMLAAALTRSAVELLFLDQDVGLTGASGFRGIYKIFKAGRKEALDGYMEQMFDLAVCYSLFPPTYITI
jgi:hypothetical protein